MRRLFARSLRAHALMRLLLQNLLLSYGISIDKEAETKDRVKHTAARVGLAVPEFDQHGAPIGMPKRTK